MIRIKAPNEHFNGVRLDGVKFRDGVAEVERLSDDARARFVSWGFEIEDPQPEPAPNPLSGPPEDAESFVQKASVKDILAAIDDFEEDARESIVAFVLSVEQAREKPRPSLVEALEPKPEGE